FRHVGVEGFGLRVLRPPLTPLAALGARLVAVLRCLRLVSVGFATRSDDDLDIRRRLHAPALDLLRRSGRGDLGFWHSVARDGYEDAHAREQKRRRHDPHEAQATPGRRRSADQLEEDLPRAKACGAQALAENGRTLRDAPRFARKRGGRRLAVRFFRTGFSGT